MTNIELAKWLHDNYEAVAKEQDWNTQQSCKVEFDTLPDANKHTMIEIADRLLNFNLLRLHFVVGQSEQFKCQREFQGENKCPKQCIQCDLAYRNYSI